MADQLAGSYTIGGFDLILSTPDARFGRATYVHSDVADASPVSSSRLCDIVQVGGFRDTIVYKPPVITGTKVRFHFLWIPRHTWLTSTAINLIGAAQNLERMERPWRMGIQQ